MLAPPELAPKIVDAFGWKSRVAEFPKKRFGALVPFQFTQINEYIHEVPKIVRCGMNISVGQQSPTVLSRFLQISELDFECSQGAIEHGLFRKPFQLIALQSFAEFLQGSLPLPLLIGKLG